MSHRNTRWFSGSLMQTRTPPRRMTRLSAIMIKIIIDNFFCSLSNEKCHSIKRKDTSKENDQTVCYHDEDHHRQLLLLFVQRKVSQHKEEATSIWHSTYTKCPKLDNTIQSRLPRPAKDADLASTHIQTLVLDAANPLINMLQLPRKGTLNTKEAAEQDSKLLWNTSVNISMGQRRKATQHLNLELVTLVDDEELFKDAAPMLSLVKHLTKEQKITSML